MKLFLVKDLTGRGFVNKVELDVILEWDDEDEYDVEELHDWAELAELGDEWICRTMKITCIEAD